MHFTILAVKFARTKQQCQLVEMSEYS